MPHPLLDSQLILEIKPTARELSQRPASDSFVQLKEPEKTVQVKVSRAATIVSELLAWRREEVNGLDVAAVVILKGVRARIDEVLEQLNQRS